MAERRGHPVAAVLIGLATLTCGFFGAGFALVGHMFAGDSPDMFTWAGLVVGGLTLPLVVGGLWLALRIGHPNPTKAGRPQGNSTAAVLIALAVGVWAVVGWRLAYMKGCFLESPCPTGPAEVHWADPGAILFLSVVGVAVLGGLWCAWRVGTGRWGRRPSPDAGEGGCDG